MGLFKAKGERAHLKVEGMTCGHCVMRVEKALNSLEGVKKVNVSLEKQEADVIYDEKKLNPDELEKAVTEAGYKVIK